MSQPSSSAKLESTWGKFPTRQAAEKTQTQLIEAGIEPDNVTLEIENFPTPIKIEDTEAINNLKSGAIAGGVLGGLIGLSISLILTRFPSIGLAAFNNFQGIHYLFPLLGAIVGGVGMSLILGISGASILKPKSQSKITDVEKSPRYLLVVKGEIEQVNLAKEIINVEGGVVEEADRR